MAKFLLFEAAQSAIQSAIVTFVVPIVFTSEVRSFLIGWEKYSC